MQNVDVIDPQLSMHHLLLLSSGHVIRFSKVVLAFADYQTEIRRAMTTTTNVGSDDDGQRGRNDVDGRRSLSKMYDGGDLLAGFLFASS